MKDVSPVQWVGEFAELVKCHNPGKPGKKFVRAKRVLRVTAVIVSCFLFFIDLFSHDTIEHAQ